MIYDAAALALFGEKCKSNDRNRPMRGNAIQEGGNPSAPPARFPARRLPVTMILHSAGNSVPDRHFGRFHFGGPFTYSLRPYLSRTTLALRCRRAAPLFCFRVVVVAIAPMHPFHFLAASRRQPHQTRRMRIEAGGSLNRISPSFPAGALPSFFAPRTSARLNDPLFCENATSTAIACPWPRTYVGEGARARARLRETAPANKKTREIPEILRKVESVRGENPRLMIRESSTRKIRVLDPRETLKYYPINLDAEAFADSAGEPRVISNSRDTLIREGVKWSSSCARPPQHNLFFLQSASRRAFRG